MKKILVFILTASLMTGCASMKESFVTGVSVGAVGGAALGNAHGSGRSRDKSTRNGAIIGALLGAGFSYLAHKDKKKKLYKVQQSKIGNKNDTPLLTQPKVKRVWVEDKVNGKRFIKGHWEYIIEEQSSWSQK
jgi:uncharacterized protein YcfJ